MQLKSILKKLIQEKGITISHLAKATGVSDSTLHNWLSGIEPRSLNQVKKVADFFNVTLDYICFGITQKEEIFFEEFGDEINAGVFEVVLRKIKKKP